MAKINFSVDATVAEFSDFADRLGYMAQILNGVDGDGQPIVTANPETKQAFLQRIMKEKVAEVFYTPFVADIDREVRTQRDADKEAVREDVRSRVTVNFTA
jgi:hypothetical protein